MNILTCRNENITLLAAESYEKFAPYAYTKIDLKFPQKRGFLRMLLRMIKL